jgi:hypothetical protein
MKTHLVVAFVLFGLVALTAQAQDFNGSWTAKVEGRNGPQDITLSLKVEGGKLSGFVVTPRGEQPIADGKVSGSEISFAAGGNRRFIYKGKLSGSEINFTREAEGGGGQAQQFVAKKKAT